MTQGRYAEAEGMTQQELQSTRQVYGEEHPSIAWDLNNLAIVYCEQGKHVEAVPLLEQARQLWSQYLGETHPHVARAYNNLAEILMIQGEYAEVEQLYRQAFTFGSNNLSRNILTQPTLLTDSPHSTGNRNDMPKQSSSTAKRCASGSK